MSLDLPSDAASIVSAARLSRFASALRELDGARDVDESLQLMVDLAIELVDGVDVADIMFVQSGRVTTPVSTDQLAVRVDQVQQEVGEGPCLSALHDQEIVVSEDLGQEDRWPAFTSTAVDLGVQSVAAYRLFREREREDRYGALNMFGRQPGIDDADVQLGAVFAVHCSAVLGREIRQVGLRSALQSRDVIGQAKGILMERHRVTAEEAYRMLRRVSNERNAKVRDLAQAIAETGDLP